MARTERPFVTIVSGVPRAGTSLLMQVLDAGGIGAVTDGARAPDASNPRGYLEHALVPRLGRDARAAALVRGSGGRALKVIHALLGALPEGVPLRVLIAERALADVVASQAAMLKRGAVALWGQTPKGQLPTADRLAEILRRAARRGAGSARGARGLPRTARRHGAARARAGHRLRADRGLPRRWPGRTRHGARDFAAVVWADAWVCWRRHGNRCSRRFGPDRARGGAPHARHLGWPVAARAPHLGRRRAVPLRLLRRGRALASRFGRARRDHAASPSKSTRSSSRSPSCAAISPATPRASGLREAVPLAAQCAAALSRIELALRNPPPAFDALSERGAARAQRREVAAVPARGAAALGRGHGLSRPPRRSAARSRARSRSATSATRCTRARRAARDLAAERMQQRFGCAGAAQRRSSCVSEVVQGDARRDAAAHAPGDGVIVQTPIYPPFLHVIREHGRTLLANELPRGADGYALDLDRPARARRSEPRSCYCCATRTTRRAARSGAASSKPSPRSRASTICSWSATRSMRISCSRRIGTSRSRRSPEDAASRTITLYAASKAFNIAGLRCAARDLRHARAEASASTGFPRHLRGGLDATGIVATEAAWTPRRSVARRCARVPATQTATSWRSS